MVSVMSNPKRSEDGRTKNPDFSILIAEDKPAKPFAGPFGAALPIKNRHMLASANDAEIVEVLRQISGKLAVGELVANGNFIHCKRHGTGEILDELSVLSFIRILDEVAPQRLGYGLYFLVGFFNNVHARFFGTVQDRICRVQRKQHVGLFASRRTFNRIVRPEELLLVCPNQMITGRLLHGVFTCLRIAAGNSQYVPVCVVDLHGVAAVVVARPASLLAEQGVLRDALCGAMPVLELPRTQQLVNILCSQALEIFLHDLELLECDIQKLVVSHVANRHPAAILVHELLQTIQALLGIDVVRVDVAGHDLVAIDLVVLQWLVNFLLSAVDLLVGYDDAFGFAVVDIFTGSLRGEAALGER